MLRKSYSLQSLHTKYPSLFDFTMQKGLFLGSLRLRINLVSPEAKKIDAVAPAPLKTQQNHTPPLPTFGVSYSPEYKF